MTGLDLYIWCGRAGGRPNFLALLGQGRDGSQSFIASGPQVIFRSAKWIDASVKHPSAG